MKNNCVNCNRETDTRQVCSRCGKLLCSDCRTKRMLCKECTIIIEDKNLITEYFRDKYASKIGGIITIMLLIIIPFAYSQVSLTPDYKKVCWDVNADYYEKQPVYNSTMISWPNGTKENRTIFLRYDDMLIKKTIQKCNETVGIGTKEVDFKLQDYNCKNTTGEVICDSCSDGNCDGICSNNGGETCARIKDGVAQYKNSVISWDEKTGFIASKLEVR